MNTTATASPSAARSATTRFNFTQKSIKAVRPPTDADRVYVYDTNTPSLALCVTAAGARSFYVIRRVNGRPQRYRLGSYGDLTIEQARTEATIKNGEIARGIDPHAGRREAREMPTVQEVFNEFINMPTRTRAKREKSARTIAEYRKQFDGYLTDLHHRRLDGIKRHEVQELHNKIGRESGHTTANRALALIRAVFNAAAELGHRVDNPAARIRPFAEQSRERFLGPDELRPFLAALADEPSEKLRDFFIFLLMTGQRRGNVQGMRWEHINMEAGVWMIPAAETKNRRPMSVPLTPQAMLILENRRKATNGDGYVFPGRHSARPLTDPFKVWREILKRSGLKNLRPHDLRRTFGSWMAAGGTSLSIIGRGLGHANQQATQIYARLDLDPVRQAATAATAAMEAAGNAPAPKRLTVKNTRRKSKGSK